MEHRFLDVSFESRIFVRGVDSYGIRNEVKGLNSLLLIFRISTLYEMTMLSWEVHFTQ